MEKIVKILMERDEYTREEALAVVNECQEAMFAALECGDTEEAEEIFMDYLGLEPDYMYDFIM